MSIPRAVPYDAPEPHGDPELVDLIHVLALAEGDPELALSNESGWTLVVFGPDYLLWENVEHPGGTLRELSGVSCGDVFALMWAIAHDDLAAVEAFPWRPVARGTHAVA